MRKEPNKVGHQECMSCSANRLPGDFRRLEGQHELSREGSKHAQEHGERDGKNETEVGGQQLCIVVLGRQAIVNGGHD